MCRIGETAEKTFCPRGQRNPLKRLSSDKEIQEKESFFFGKIWVRLGAAWRGFAGFAENLAALDRRAWGDYAESACRTGREQLGFVRDLFTQSGDSSPGRV
jgi:hypothetical protein